ncbi:hypothetical protein R4R92_004555 [Citrobacter freundii]|uniref:hypothetical protein n=1 Tax=Citrobacter TaxID=544 RepID=UPI0015E914B8|nr:MULTISPECIES: hypothetical protein [Citrobacter]EFL9618744.1 hypothetical protein [Escherichia coli]EGT5658393.1 hypothetical protein [Citrobacter braakii]EIQ9245460.1 hypothetical protein [Escherichia coli]ELK1249866.1 hypothetical protein [Citrobacter freundii]MCQ6312238.1 hypothetical protein [Citrobacter portucalensis]
MFQFFQRRYHFWSLCFYTEKGFQSIIYQSKKRRLTPMGIAVAAQQENFPANTPLVSASHLGRMTVKDAEKLS